MNKPQFVLSLSCPDRPGIVHRVSGFLVENGANILEAAQFNDVGSDRFFMRVQFECSEAGLTAATLTERFESTAHTLSMQANFFAMATRVRTLLMVSKQGHCLNDLLFRHKSGQLTMAGMSIGSWPLLWRNSKSFRQCPCFDTINSARTRVVIAKKFACIDRVRAVDSKRSVNAAAVKPASLLSN